MAGINYGKVILGGLAAGVVANIFDFVSNNILMADDMVRMAQRLGLDQQMMASPSVAITWITIDFLYGILIVWNYAAMRPRFGSGPGTAVKAGLVLWLAIALILYGFLSMGIFTPDSFFKSAALTFVSTVVAALAGGYVYKE